VPRKREATVSIGLVSDDLIDWNYLRDWTKSRADNKHLYGVTAIADLFWSLCSDVHLSIDVRKPLDWNAIRTELETKLGDSRIRKLTFSGHGGPGSLHGLVNLDDLQNENSEQYRFFRWLKQKSTWRSTIRLYLCEVAQGDRGKEFLALFGKLTGCRVHAWDDWYAIYPFGREYAGSPSGEWAFVRDTNRRWQGSLLQRLHSPQPRKRPPTD
jgi:hypothetical protein